MNLSLLLCIFAFCFAPLAYASDCGQSLDGTPQNLDSEIRPDDRAVRWLEDLLGAVTNWPVDDARAAVTRLLAGSRESPVSESAVSNNPDLQIHRQELAELMQEVSDPVAVGRALQAELDRREGSTQRRGETREKIEQDLNCKMNFGEIPPGTFAVYIHNNSYLIRIPNRFWMQLTPVTRWQLGEILPNLKRDDRTANSPAVDLTYDEAQALVDKLNEWARTGDPRLLKVVPGHQPTWRYSLPDAWEWMYVAYNLAANSSSIDSWQQDYDVRGLTLGGFTTMNQAAHLQRSGDITAKWEVGELEPMNINGNEFHDLGGTFETWLRLNLWAPKNPDFQSRPKPKLRLTIETLENISKELKWFFEKILQQPPLSIGTSSYVWGTNSRPAPLLAFYNVNSTRKHPTRGIRLITFEADAETDARMSSSTPANEAATLVRLGATYLAYSIDKYPQSSSHEYERSYLFNLLPYALNDWKQGRRNLEFEKIFESHPDLTKFFQHPVLDLPRFALELEAQLKTRRVTL